MNNFYVYLLLDPLDFYSPFYVGKGCGDRWRHHLRKSGGKSDKNWIKNERITNIENANEKVTVIFWQKELTEDAAFSLERDLIVRFGRLDLKTGILTNRSAGGNGCPAMAWDSDQRSRQSKRMSGSGNCMFGKTHSVAARESISKFRKINAVEHPFTHSEEHCARMRVNNPGGRAVARSITQYDIDFNVIKVWESIQLAAKTLNCSKGNIWVAANTKKNLKISGYYWRYTNE